MVEGLCYLLSPADEESLDLIEGVSTGAYSKENLRVEVFPGNALIVGGRVHEVDAHVKSLDRGNPQLDGASSASIATCLVYVNSEETRDGIPKEEYVHRIAAGTQDAIKLGMSQQYYDKYIEKPMTVERPGIF
jgi:hypothetical protein